MILEAVTLKSTVPKKTTQSSTGITHVSCPVPNCTFHAEIPKKAFHVLPKSDGFKNNLNFGEDYKVHYDAECSMFPMSKLQYIGKFLLDLKTNYEAHNRDLVDSNEPPLLLEPYIYFYFVLKKRGSTNLEIWRLKQAENNKSSRVASSYKIGRPPKSGDDEECV
eukprot:4524072-Ditylum_brightwellii.AAC.2